MGHYAFLDENNIVTEVIVGRNEDEVINGIADWEEYYGKIRGQKCKRTSYNTLGGVYTNPETKKTSKTKAFRKNYAGIGFTYDEDRDAFIPPKPFNSWLLDEDTCLWNAPVAYPTDGKIYTWNEDTTSWVEIESP
jgi:hypothetical protein